MNMPAKIIVVDDEKQICENVEKILKKSKYNVVKATSADEAMAKMAGGSFSLLISDIVMPGKNGLELLKLVKDQWPLTKAIMMTAYASTDTAVKAIRMGALDYIPKPFTPDELRSTVEGALRGEISEVDIDKKERETIEVIDIDMPFDRDEVSKYTGDEYVDMMGPSDIPVVEIEALRPPENFCEMGDMVCDIFKKLGATCKAGTKTNACPQKKAKKRKESKEKESFDSKKLIGIDQPFSYEEVVSVTGPEYIRNYRSDGVSTPYYEDLKANVAKMMQTNNIDVDMPFDYDEVVEYTDDEYAKQLTRSDIPSVEVTVSESIENYCEVGDMVCDIFKKLGATCKAGTKTNACPQKKAKKRKESAKKKAFDSKRLISIDQPFEFEEVAAVTGENYVNNLVYEGVVQAPYEQLKQNYAQLLKREKALEAFSRESTEHSIQNDILIIDDEVAVNNNIRKILVKKGYQADQAVTKEEAFEQIGKRSYSLILLDLKIPGVKGLELLSFIRDRSPKTRVIMITGYASIETAVESARMGVVDYLPKPFTPNEIRNATERALKIAA